MGTSPSNKLLPITLLSIDSASFSGAYQLVGKLSQPIRFLRIVNNSNQDVTVSFDGSTAHDFVPKTTVMQLPAGALGQAGNFSCMIPAGTGVYVNGAAGMGNSGLVYVAGYYQPYNP